MADTLLAQAIQTYRSCDCCMRPMKDAGVAMPFDRPVMGTDETTPVIVCQLCSDRFSSIAIDIAQEAKDDSEQAAKTKR